MQVKTPILNQWINTLRLLDSLLTPRTTSLSAVWAQRSVLPDSDTGHRGIGSPGLEGGMCDAHPLPSTCQEAILVAMIKFDWKPKKLENWNWAFGQSPVSWTYQLPATSTAKKTSNVLFGQKGLCFQSSWKGQMDSELSPMHQASNWVAFKFQW